MSRVINLVTDERRVFQVVGKDVDNNPSYPLTVIRSDYPVVYNGKVLLHNGPFYVVPVSVLHNKEDLAVTVKGDTVLVRLTESDWITEEQYELYKDRAETCDDEVPGYKSLKQLLLEGGEVIIPSDGLDLEAPVILTKPTVITLNGDIVSRGQGLICEADVTIQGVGHIRAGNNNQAFAVRANKGTLTIKSGEFSVSGDENGEGNSCIYACNDANVVIEGGEFSTDKPYGGIYYVLNQNNSSTGTITVKGGSFYKYDPSAGDDNKGGNFVAEGYRSVLGSDGETYFVEPIA